MLLLWLMRLNCLISELPETLKHKSMPFIHTSDETLVSAWGRSDYACTQQLASLYFSHMSENLASAYELSDRIGQKISPFTKIVTPPLKIWLIPKSCLIQTRSLSFISFLTF